MSDDSRADTGWLTAMSRPELDRLFRASPPGDIPRGTGAGTVLPGLGARVSRVLARVVRGAIWRGKVFDSGGSELRDLVTPWAVPVCPARAYRDASLLDGHECIVLDRSPASPGAPPRRRLPVARVREEIRRIGPGLYLGVVHWGQRRVVTYALRFPMPHA
ncbi:hypothetical protein GCM10010218_41370 [Streptomyces mashuensis]|uniref:Uncharacterized protein n=1 Tax=Streptomyces mashuensis TaxID=33904 RepID=A0A919B549_9ACTN|nr:hypothetical protein [Streptomyces mashuensis]GHF55557.1 hypothetical protein GCM10010218_41370 [Streptomyces mashuensis]